MPNSRRDFLRSSAVAAAGLGAVIPRLKAQAALFGETSPLTASELQVPRVKFGKAEISRVVVGCNPFYGYSHVSRAMDAIMREWYTPDRICAVLHQCNRFGINAFNYLHRGRAPDDWERFRAEGGAMHLIAQGDIEPELIVKAVHPLAVYRHGELTDAAFQNRQMSTVRDYCKKLRQLGVLVGVGTHKPEVIATVEEEGWDVDFYAGCVYNRTRTREEFRSLLGSELPLPPSEVYLEGDPPRMYKVMRQTTKPCFAFKILAAGRIEQPEAVERAYRTAFESLKPTDCIFVGMFPRVRDEVRENAEHVHRVLAPV